MRAKLLTVSLSALLIGGCASRAPEVALAPPVPIPPRGVAAAPQPPSGATADMVLPARGSDGRFVTPNSALTADEAAWHLRAALNVAALGCRDADEPQTIAAYNAMLASRKAVLASADAGVRALYRQRHGAAAWQAEHDAAMTRLYNFFALPPVQGRFCAEAKAVLGEIGTLTAQDFVAAAPAALTRIEAPFLAFYEEYARYRTAYAQWQAQGSVTMAAASR